MKSIGIIGVGMVGGAHKRYYEKNGFETKCYDPGKNFSDPVAVRDNSIALVCVPTPHEEKSGGFNLEYVRLGLRLLKPGAIAIIKSTILPGSTEILQKEFPELKIIFSPEFLSEATADIDVSQPIRQIVGFTEKSKDVAEEALKILPPAKFSKIVRARDAEMVKYFGNSWYATKVVFANQMYDLCQKIGVDYNVVKECVAPEPMVGGTHLEIFHKGYRGYGGKCLPKDTRSIIQLGDKVGSEMSLLKKVEEINNFLTEGNKK